MDSRQLKDPLIVILLVVGLLIFVTKILPLLASLASIIFWIALFVLIALYVYPPTRGAVERFFNKIFK